MDVERTAQQLTERQARKLTDRIAAVVETAWALLITAYEGGAAEALGYKSWTAYVQEEFGVSRSHAYRLLDWVQVVNELSASAQASIPETVAAVGPEGEVSPEGTDVKQAVAEVITPAEAGMVKQVLPTVGRSVRAAVARGADPVEAVARAVAKHTPTLDRVRELKRAIETIVNAKEKELREVGAGLDVRTAALIAGKLSSAAAAVRGAAKRDVVPRMK